jgi:hypothetical protein
MLVAWSDILSAFEFVSGGDGGEMVFLSRETGETFWHSDGDNFEELPGDIDDREKYVKLPNKRDLDLGQRLVMRFTREELPNRYTKVVEIFSRRGAYRRFKDLLEHEGALDKWFEFENAAQEKALRKWCAENGVVVEG